jgi:hypothetical protein
MQEVTIRIRFTRDCLGATKRRNHRGRTKFVMLRDCHGRVIFLPTWWRNLMDYAAKVTNRYGGLALRINWDSVIDGEPDPNVQRTVVAAIDDPHGRRRYAVHEAFRTDDVIGVNAVLPTGLSIDALTDLLTVGGTYRGISPFQDDTNTCGKFEVVSIKPTVRGGTP